MGYIAYNVHEGDILTAFNTQFIEGFCISWTTSLELCNSSNQNQQELTPTYSFNTKSSKQASIVV
jgi:hypothetical protein